MLKFCEKTILIAFKFFIFTHEFKNKTKEPKKLSDKEVIIKYFNFKYRRYN